MSERILRQYEAMGQLGSAIRHLPPEKRRKVWKLAYALKGLPPAIVEKWFASKHRKAKEKRMSVARAALKAGRLECCNDDELLELGHEWAAREVQHRDHDWEKEATYLANELKRRAAGE